VSGRRAFLGAVAAGLSLPGLSYGRVGLRLAEFGGHPGGEDISAALARGLAAAAARGVELMLDPGTYVIGRPPGLVRDPHDHDVPELRDAAVMLRGAGARRTRLLSRPRPTAANRNLPVSAPILKSVGAERVLIEGLTLDGGILRGEPGLRAGPDAEAAALLEIHEARFCRLRDVAVTGFAGHHDTRTPERGNFGRRGPVLLARCDEVELVEVTLRHPTFREGLFVHDARRVLVRGFRHEGPDSASERGVSTPLNIVGGRSEEVLIEDFATRGVWAGSLMNLGGPGHFTLRRIRARGLITAPQRHRPGQDAPLELRNGGKGIDIGAEINEAGLPAQACTTLLRLEDVLLEDMQAYAIKATRRPDCALGKLSLGPGVRVEGGFQALSASHVGEVEGSLTGLRLLGYEGARDRTIAVPLSHCGGGRLALALEGLPGARQGVWRMASSRLVLTGRIGGFAGGGLVDDVRDSRDDLRWDALCEGLEIGMPAGASAPAFLLGRGPTRRLRQARLIGCSIDGQSLQPRLAGLVLHAGEWVIR
jgi:hypothetical protein